MIIKPLHYTSLKVVVIEDQQLMDFSPNKTFSELNHIFENLKNIFIQRYYLFQFHRLS
jgi:hypothetical protein